MRGFIRSSILNVNSFVNAREQGGNEASAVYVLTHSKNLAAARVRPRRPVTHARRLVLN